jgi:hypothetical protein
MPEELWKPHLIEASTTYVTLKRKPESNLKTRARMNT